MTFWNKYFKEKSNLLGKRTDTFKKIFKYLDRLKKDEICIVETGCYREEDNFTGDGCSTLLFDNYIENRKGYVISVDINPKACQLARENTSNNVDVICGDSVEELSYLEGIADLLYLDSYNIENWNDDWESSSHHLKELFAAKNIIKKGTLIVVDDNIRTASGKVIGKGRLVYELMEALNIKPFFDEYQIGWIWKE